MNPARPPVVVVVGQPDDTLVANLQTVGLVPIAEEGDVVIWGPPPPARHARQPMGSTDQPPTPGHSGLLMTIGDAALALGLGRSTVYELIGRGELEVVHVGRSARVPTEALRALVNRLRTDATAEEPRPATG